MCTIAIVLWRNSCNPRLPPAAPPLATGRYIAALIKKYCNPKEPFQQNLYNIMVMCFKAVPFLLV